MLGGPVVKTSPSNVGDVDFIPDQETEIPHGSWPKKTKHKSNIVTNLIKTVKVVHIKEKKTKTKLYCLEVTVELLGS